MQDIGPAEPTVSLPVSVIASVYPADDIKQSIQMMEQDFLGQKHNQIFLIHHKVD